MLAAVAAPGESISEALPIRTRSMEASAESVEGGEVSVEKLDEDQPTKDEDKGGDNGEGKGEDKGKGKEKDKGEAEPTENDTMVKKKKRGNKSRSKKKVRALVPSFFQSDEAIRKSTNT